MTRRPPVARLALAATAAATLALAVPGAHAQIWEHGIRESPVGVHLFTNARIVVSPERTIENGALLVADGRVVAVGAEVDAPAWATTHDLGGKTILPGFVEPMSDYGLGHLPEPERQRGGRALPRYEPDRTGAVGWNEAIHAEMDWIDQFRPDGDAAEALLGRGVTTVQSARMDGIFRGRAFVATLGDGDEHEVATVVLEPYGPHVLSFDKGSSQQAYPSSLMGSIALVRQALLDGRWFRDHGASGDLEVDRALAAIAAIDGPVLFVTDDVHSLFRAARIGEEMDVEIVHVGKGDEYPHVSRVAALGRPLVLPLSYPETPEVKTAEDELDVDLAELRRWEQAPSTAAALVRAGVPVAFTGHGLRDDEDFLANLRLAVARGLAPADALAALTTVPARLAGVDDEVGTLDPGKLASFAVVDGDLFADREAELTAVWVAGELRHELRADDEHDFRGDYLVKIGDREVTIRLSGERGKLRGELVEGERTAELEDVRSSLDSLSFSVPMGEPDEEAESEGLARFSIREVRGEVRGQVTLPDGMPAPIMMDPKVPDPEPDEPDAEVEVAAATSDETAGETEDEEAEEAAEEKKADVLASPDLVSRVTTPNVAYGLTAPPAQEDVVVRGATVWTLEADAESEGRMDDADLLVRGGKIAAVGRDLAAPAGVREIDGSGLHVTPGIIDEHSHLAIAGGVNEGSHAVTAEVRIGDVVDSTDVGIYRALAGGTTAAQLLHGSANPIGGQAQVIKMRWGQEAEAMKLAAAPPSIKFALGENVKQSNWGDEYTVRYPQTRMGVETIMRDRFLAAREHTAELARWEGMSERERRDAVARGETPARRDLQLETLAEILDGERFVHCHSYVQSEILMLMRLAEELGFRVGTFTHILEGYKVAPEMAAHGVGASTFADWWAYKFEVYDAIPYNTCLLHKHGVLTSVNSDSGELIRHLNQEAAKSVLYCGMEEVEALKLVTLNPAKQLLVDDRVGSLAVGKDADFVIWNGHPLSSYSKPLQTWVDGAPYFTVERDAELRAAVAAERQALVQKVLRAGGGEKKGPPGGKDRRQRPAEGWDCEDTFDYWSLNAALDLAETNAHEEAR